MALRRAPGRTSGRGCAPAGAPQTERFGGLWECPRIKRIFADRKEHAANFPVTSTFIGVISGQAPIADESFRLGHEKRHTGRHNPFMARHLCSIGRNWLTPIRPDCIVIPVLIDRKAAPEHTCRPDQEGRVISHCDSGQGQTRRDRGEGAQTLEEDHGQRRHDEAASCQPLL